MNLARQLVLAGATVVLFGGSVTVAQAGGYAPQWRPAMVDVGGQMAAPFGRGGVPAFRPSAGQSRDFGYAPFPGYQATARPGMGAARPWPVANRSGYRPAAAPVMVPRPVAPAPRYAAPGSSEYGPVPRVYGRTVEPWSRFAGRDAYARGGVPPQPAARLVPRLSESGYAWRPAMQPWAMPSPQLSQRPAMSFPAATGYPVYPRSGAFPAYNWRPALVPPPVAAPAMARADARNAPRYRPVDAVRHASLAHPAGMRPPTLASAAGTWRANRPATAWHNSPSFRPVDYGRSVSVEPVLAHNDAQPDGIGADAPARLPGWVTALPEPATPLLACPWCGGS